MKRNRYCLPTTQQTVPATCITLQQTKMKTNKTGERIKALKEIDVCAPPENNHFAEMHYVAKNYQRTKEAKTKSKGNKPISNCLFAAQKTKQKKLE